MSKARKNGSKNDDTLAKFIILATAILNLIKALVDLIGKLLE